MSVHGMILYGDKNMVNFIANTRKKKKSHVDVTSIFSEKLRDFQLGVAAQQQRCVSWRLPVAPDICSSPGTIEVYTGAQKINAM